MYLSLVREQLADAGCRILAYCLMIDHVHLVAVPERADSLAVLFRRAHGRHRTATCGSSGIFRALWPALIIGLRCVTWRRWGFEKLAASA